MASLLEVVQKQLDKMHPIGSYYLTEDGNNPSVSLGFGTWVKIEGKFLLGSSSSYATANEGGEATHVLTVTELPSHSHLIRHNMEPNGGYVPQGAQAHAVQAGNATHYTGSGVMTDRTRSDDVFGGSGFIQATGSNIAHNNMPPYRVVNIWRRTA